jgi:SAM-dependent methyltransferase
MRGLTVPLRNLTDLMSRALRGKLHLPPKHVRDVGDGDFEATGAEFLGHFIGAGLAPSHRVLDIGCGCGRMALPLTRYLHNDGSYIGMDVAYEPVAWCQRHITRRHPQFRFYHADLHNARYNPTGTSRAAEYSFPFDDGSFDFIFLTSVFTHMLPDGVERYAQELARLLAPAGKALATFFLCNEAQQRLAAQGRSRFAFPVAHGVYRISDKAIPESAVAFEESYVRRLFGDHGLQIAEPVSYGTWSGRPDGRSIQDIVVLSRRMPS